MPIATQRSGETGTRNMKLGAAQLKADIASFITWFGHSSFALNGSKRIYLDPWKLPADIEGKRLALADIIMITHPHPDHFSLDDIKRLVGEQTRIVAHPDCKGIESAVPASVEIVYAKPGEKIMLDDITVDVVAAYNVNKKRPDGAAPHPQEAQWNGYIIRLDGNTIYFAGDTDVIAEMSDFPNIDIAFLPISGTYVMTVQEAVQAAAIIKPRLAAIPMHYGSIIGSIEDGATFAKLVGPTAKLLIRHPGEQKM